MTWKNTWIYFVYQSLLRAANINHFFQILSLYNQWRRSFSKGRNSINDESPWINFFSLEYLNDFLQDSHKVFEFGGGGSTLFFCKTASQVVTVEHDKKWFKVLENIVEQKGYRNWEGHFIEPEKLIQPQNRLNPENPNDFTSNSQEFDQWSFEKYAKSITKFPKNYFDVILVDGRARPSCFIEALPHLKHDGIIVFDNTERSYYRKVINDTIQDDFQIILDQYAPVLYTPDFTITTILKKVVD